MDSQAAERMPIAENESFIRVYCRHENESGFGLIRRVNIGTQRHQLDTLSDVLNPACRLGNRVPEDWLGKSRVSRRQLVCARKEARIRLVSMRLTTRLRPCLDPQLMRHAAITVT
jgi:hypothetical protein